MAYDQLSDEDKVELAIGFVARGAPLPVPLAEYLKNEGMYELITNPMETINEYCKRDAGGHKT